MTIQIQLAVAAGIVALFILSTLLLVKREHAGDAKGRIVIGSAIEGVIVGMIAAFLMMPRLISLDPSFHMTPTEQLLTLPMQAVLLPAALLMEFVRNGGLAHVPGLSHFLLPRKRANLLRRKIAIDKQLAKLDASVPGPNVNGQVSGAG